jgi:hypothetical protein
MSELRRRTGGGDGGASGGAFSQMTAEEVDALIAAQAEAFGSSDDGGGGDDSGSDGPDSESEDGAPRLPWALRNPALLLSWASLAAVFALQPAGRRMPQTLDLAITAVRAPTPAQQPSRGSRARALRVSSR